MKTQLLVAVGTLAALLVGGAGRVAAIDGVKLIGQPTKFPIVISTSGSYRLKHNITVPDANTTAISVQADYVTIDLNGFSIQGPVVCAGSPASCSPNNGTGIGVDGGAVLPTPYTGITVRNGVVRGMGLDGVALATASRVQNVTAASNGRAGIQAYTVSDSTAVNNGGHGIIASNAVTNSQSTSNGRTGISSSSGPVTNCEADYNGEQGIVSNTVTGCTADWNVGNGIQGGTVANSTAVNNSGQGIWANTVTGCTAGSNGLPQINAPGILGQNICGPPFPGTPCP